MLDIIRITVILILELLTEDKTVGNLSTGTSILKPPYPVINFRLCGSAVQHILVQQFYKRRRLVLRCVRRIRCICRSCCSCRCRHTLACHITVPVGIAYCHRLDCAASAQCKCRRIFLRSRVSRRRCISICCIIDDRIRRTARYRHIIDIVVRRNRNLRLCGLLYNRRQSAWIRVSCPTIQGTRRKILIPIGFFCVRTCIACQIRIIYGVAPFKIFIVDGTLICPGTVYIIPRVVDTHLIPLMVITCHRNTVNTHTVAHHLKRLRISSADGLIHAEYAVYRLCVCRIFIKRVAINIRIIIHFLHNEIVNHFYFFRLRAE